MMQAGGASAGSRTMLDALLPAAEALVAGKSLAEAAEAAKAGQEATKTMAPRAGRSENVPKDSRELESGNGRALDRLPQTKAKTK